jgi:hypothetical protein
MKKLSSIDSVMHHHRLTYTTRLKKYMVKELVKEREGLSYHVLAKAYILDHEESLACFVRMQKG